MKGVLVSRITKQSDNLVVEWFPGFPSYQLQGTSSLNGVWHDVGPPTALTSITNAIVGTVQFFRVIGLPY